MTQLARDISITLPNEEALGPSMAALTVPQRAFVLAFVEQGGVNATEAARRAGYGGTNGSTRTAAHALKRHPLVLRAIKEEADKRLKSHALLATQALVEIAADPMHRDRFKAAVELLNRAGLMVQDVSRVIMEDHRTPEEIERRIAELAAKLQIDPRKLGANMGGAAATF